MTEEIIPIVMQKSKLDYRDLSKNIAFMAFQTIKAPTQGSRSINFLLHSPPEAKICRLSPRWKNSRWLF